MRRMAMAAAALALAGAGCTSTSEAKLDAREFTTRIDHPYWPMAPGSRWVYRETEGGANQKVVVTVTRELKRVAAGVTARVIHDRVTEKGRLIEDTFDWFAQDRHGNLWYLGENTKEYSRGGKVSTKGSWEAGVRGARAGIALPAHPRVGMAYRQEYLRGEAEDRARVLSLDEKAEVPFGFYARTLMTKDYTALEPRLLEHKFYARGVGPVLTIPTSGGSGREALVKFRRG
jgi:hypothetical protein